MGAFFSDQWMKYFVDRHSDAAAFDRMGWSIGGGAENSGAGAGAEQSRGVGVGGEGTAAAILAELTAPDRMAFAAEEFNAAASSPSYALKGKGREGRGEGRGRGGGGGRGRGVGRNKTTSPLASKGQWTYLKGRESQYGSWVGEYSFKEPHSVRAWVSKHRSKQDEREADAKIDDIGRWDFDQIIAL